MDLRNKVEGVEHLSESEGITAVCLLNFLGLFLNP